MPQYVIHYEGSNNITCLKTLRKAFFPNLKGIMLRISAIFKIKIR